MPDVPAVALLLLPGLLVDADGELADVVELAAPEPMWALVSMNCPRDVLAEVEPATPLVPVAPAVVLLLPPPERHPVTVTARLPPGEVWLLLVVEPDCAEMLAAQQSAIATVAPVHTLFMRYLQ